MILCAERFDREQGGKAMPTLDATFPRCACGSRELFPVGDLAARQSSLHLHDPLIQLTNRRGRRLSCRSSGERRFGEEEKLTLAKAATAQVRQTPIQA